MDERDRRRTRVHGVRAPPPASGVFTARSPWFARLFSRSPYRRWSGGLGFSAKQRAPGRTKPVPGRDRIEDVMARNQKTLQPPICATCEIAIAGSPTYHDGIAFCCAGCAAGGPCICSYDEETAGDSRVRHCRDLDGLLDSRPGRFKELALASRR